MKTTPAQEAETFAQLSDRAFAWLTRLDVEPRDTTLTICKKLRRKFPSLALRDALMLVEGYLEDSE